jgi:hypothetical protein
VLVLPESPVGDAVGRCACPRTSERPQRRVACQRNDTAAAGSLACALGLEFRTLGRGEKMQSGGSLDPENGG